MFLRSVVELILRGTGSCCPVSRATLIETAFTARTARTHASRVIRAGQHHKCRNSPGGRWRREGHIVRLDVCRATPCVLADGTRHASLERAQVGSVLAVKVFAVPPYGGEVRRPVRSAAATASRARTARRVLHPARAIRRCRRRQRRRRRRRRSLRP